MKSQLKWKKHKTDSNGNTVYTAENYQIIKSTEYNFGVKRYDYQCYEIKEDGSHWTVKNSNNVKSLSHAKSICELDFEFRGL